MNSKGQSDLSDLVPWAMFGAKLDNAAVQKTIEKRIKTVPLTNDSVTLKMVREDGNWRVDTDWAERAEARKKTARVDNQNAFPLWSFTAKLTFLNGGAVMDVPHHETYRTMSFFASRVLDAGASTRLEGTGLPPADGIGQDRRAEVTACEMAD